MSPMSEFEEARQAAIETDDGWLVRRFYRAGLVLSSDDTAVTEWAAAVCAGNLAHAAEILREREAALGVPGLAAPEYQSRCSALSLMTGAQFSFPREFPGSPETWPRPEAIAAAAVQRIEQELHLGGLSGSPFPAVYFGTIQVPPLPFPPVFTLAAAATAGAI